MMNSTIFRKASMDRVSSPEQLNDYIKVSRPSVWLILGAVIVLLVGVCVWGVYGTLTTETEALAVVQGGGATCYVTPEAAKELAPGMAVQVEGQTGEITAIAAAPMEITADFDPYALYVGNLMAGDWMVPVTVSVSVPDGVYLASIELESIAPVSFVLN